MPLKRTYIIFFTSLIAAIVAILVFFYIFNLIKNKNDNSSKMLSEIQQKNDQKDNISTLQKTVNDVKEKEAHLSSYLVHSNLLNQFISFLENEGASVNVPVEVVSVSTPTDIKNSIQVEIKGKGSFEHVMRLLSLIENAPYQIKIQHSYINKVIDSGAVSSVVTTSTTTVKPVSTAESMFEINLAFDVVSTE